MVRGTTSTMLISGPLLLAMNFEKWHLVCGILADCCCSVNLAYFHLSHFPQAHYRCLLSDVDRSTGVWKAVQRLEIPLQLNAIACSLLPCVRLPVQNLMLKFRLLKFSVFIFVSRRFIRNTVAPYEISRYTVLTDYIREIHLC